jgi:hypothetical protein
MGFLATSSVNDVARVPVEASPAAAYSPIEDN